MSPEPSDLWPIDVSALTPKQRETLYTDAVRRAHQERSEAIRLSLARLVSIFKKPAAWTEAVMWFAALVGAAAKRMLSTRDRPASS